MKTRHIVLSTFLYGLLSLGMLTIEAPEGDFATGSVTEFVTNGSYGQFYAQAVPGERRRVRRRTRRRTRRRVERREKAANFSMNFTKTYIA